MTEHKLKAIVLLEEAQHMTARAADLVSNRTDVNEGTARDLSRIAAKLQWKIDQLRNGPDGRNGSEDTSEPVLEVDAADFFELDQLRDPENGENDGNGESDS